jgi:2-dehydropantoate 2-reductase
MIKRVAIVGAGAMGSLFAAHLSGTAAEIWAFDVWREHVDEIRRHGLTVRRDGVERVVRVHATTRPDEAGPCDAVMVFVKFNQTNAAMQAARPMVGPGSFIVTLQNGIGNVEIIEAAFPGTPVVTGLTTLTSELLGPGRIEASYAGGGETHLWPRSGKVDQAVEQFRALLVEAGIVATLEPDIELKIWKKLVVNCCLNTMCAITGQRVGAVADAPESWPFLDGVVDEIVAVAQRRGIPLERADAGAFLRSVANEARNHEPSMLIDVRNGRATEIECLNGAVLRECERYGIAAQHNRALYALIRVMERTARTRSADA